MARPLEFLRDINKKKDFWKLTIKIRNKCIVVKDGKEHIEMVIVDAKVRCVHFTWFVMFWL